MCKLTIEGLRVLYMIIKIILPIEMKKDIYPVL